MPDNSRPKRLRQIDPEDVETTKWWIVFAVGIYTILSLLAAILGSSGLMPGTLAASRSPALSVVNLGIAAFAGYTIEYGRAKVQMVDSEAMTND